jgi:chemotaxis protein CheD
LIASTTATVVVPMAELHVVQGTGRLLCLGLGSCIGLCAFDPVAGVAGMAHLMLPQAHPSRPAPAAKFADTGVPALIAQMESAGGVRSRLVFAMVGGAQVFRYGAPGGHRLEIGQRNVEAVLAALERENLTLKGRDTGGNSGRTVFLDADTGDVVIRTASGAPITLCNLKEN